MTLNELEKYINENGSRANSLRDNGKTQEALTIYNEMIKKVSKSPYKKNSSIKNYLSIIYNCRGGVRENLGLVSEAISDYDMSIKFNPHDGSSYNNKAGAKRILYMHGKALVDFNSAVSLDSTNHNYFRNRAVLKVDLHMYPEALEDFDKSLMLNPKCDSSYYFKGLCLYYMSENEKAKDFLEKALYINSSNDEYKRTYEFLSNLVNIQNNKTKKIENTTTKGKEFLQKEGKAILDYKKLMLEINKRMLFIKSINLNNDNEYTQDEIEIIALNIRKILELISLSSLVANEKQLDKTRKEINKIWRAKEQLKLIESKNQNFYIDPAKYESSIEGTKKIHKFIGINENKELKKYFLSRDVFEKIYDKCGDLLHATSPFKPIDLNYYKTEIPTWLRTIETTLKSYIINLNNGKAYLIEMDSHTGIRMIIMSE
ncbi:tetratricopeptide repeat protein [Aliarcobacter butzleri]|uniref:tetratricopeptide repeat protein n=1 Tax=Aliarcobacter butzleri TaxID=28197 RepID=UPI003AFADAF1